MIAVQNWLPEFSRLVMIWAALIAVGGEGGGDLRGAVLARRSPDRVLPPERALHVMHLATMTLAAALAGTATGWWEFTPLAGLVRVGLVVLLVWSVGDLIPRLLAGLAPELVPHARRLAMAAAPVYGPLLWMAGRFDQPVQSGSSTAERAAASHAMVRGVFSLKAMTVSEVMTPRLDIVSVHQDATEDEVMHTLRNSEHARLMVDAGSADQVVGVIYAKDVLARMGDVQDTQEPWTSLIRPPAYVPEAKTLDRQLRDFQRGPGHIAVVVDEYGGTAGIVTLEDILEQIVGEIQDEHDVDEIAPLTRHDDGHLTVLGGVALVDLEQELGQEFEREDVDTVGGLILAELGRVPRSGDRLTLDGWRFDVEVVHRRRVRRVSVWPETPADEQPAELEAES